MGATLSCQEKQRCNIALTLTEIIFLFSNTNCLDRSTVAFNVFICQNNEG